MLQLIIYCISCFFGVQSLLSESCGQRATLTREYVHHGTQANLGEWPWHVAVFHQMNRAAPSYACGGTLISDRYVLTAAHCTFPRNKVRLLKQSEMFVRAGIANILELEPSLQQLALEKILSHEDFNTGTLENDIALLKLVADVAITDFVRPICFWSGDGDERLIVGKVGHIAGWGRDEHNVLSDVLKSAKMPIVSRQSCRDSDRDYYTRYLYDRKTLCAGFRNGTSAGPGDSGGGLYLETDSKWILRGIVSNGKADLINIIDTKNFVVFTDVAYYINWIKLKLDGSDASNILDTPGDDFAICGKKPRLKSTRRGYREERLWPWKGDVHRRGNSQQICEAAIINENFMLAPADAFNEKDIRNPSQFVVNFYVFKMSKDSLFQSKRVGRIVPHQNFNRETRANNIALIEFKAPIRFTELIRPICFRFEEPVGPFSSFFVGNLGYLGTVVVDRKENCWVYSNQSKTSLRTRIRTFRGSVPDLLYTEDEGTWYLRGITTNIERDKHLNSREYCVVLQNLSPYVDWIQENAVVASDNVFSHEHCPGPHAWMNSVHYRGEEKCLSSLITSTLALTVADCVYGLSLDEMSFYSNSDKASKISAAYSHPLYDNQLLTNNIAIIELSQPVNITPICLPKHSAKLTQFTFRTMIEGGSEDYGVHYTGVYLGWEFEPVNVSLINVRYCAREWAHGNTEVDIDGSHICAHMLVDLDRQPPCEKSFVGVPLFYRDDGENATYLRGLLDIPKPDHCQMGHLAEVFIDVMHHAEWIVGIAAGNTSDDQFTSAEQSPSRAWKVIA